jgi:anaphase-promoting complex subunit 8
LGIPNGDLQLAKEYTERVAASNAEDVGRAAELLKAVKLAIQAKAVEADTPAKTGATSEVVSTQASGSEPIETEMAIE